MPGGVLTPSQLIPSCLPPLDHGKIKVLSGPYEDELSDCSRGGWMVYSHQAHRYIEDTVVQAVRQCAWSWEAA